MGAFASHSTYAAPPDADPAPLAVAGRPRPAAWRQTIGAILLTVIVISVGLYLAGFWLAWSLLKPFLHG